MSAFFDDVFSKYHCGFWKGYSTEHCNMKRLEKWKKYASKRKIFDALLTDFSKALNCLDHQLLTAKLNQH